MEINLELLKKILIQIEEGRSYQNISKEYEGREIAYHCRLIAEKYYLAEYSNDKAQKAYLFTGLTLTGDKFLKAIQDEEIYHKIKPIVLDVGLDDAIEKAIQLLRKKHNINSSEVASKNTTNFNFQGANFGGAFAGQDYYGNVINNHSNENLTQTVKNADTPNGKNYNYKQIQKALTEAFPSYQKLKIMVRFTVDENLDRITSNQNNLSEATFNLIEWANSHGKLPQLIEGAYRENSGNELLKLCYQEIFTVN